MVIRIVRMTFTDEGAKEFLPIFEKHKSSIRHFPGCSHLELLKDIRQPNTYTTLSHWDKPESLENYRQSELFEHVWGKTKMHFAEKTQAFSFEKFIEVD